MRTLAVLFICLGILTHYTRHVKQLESRSAMLDVALANADEANRRLEDSRILVEQLRAENQALRTALSGECRHIRSSSRN